jgi:tRNA(Ile)-lysidine synthase
VASSSRLSGLGGPGYPLVERVINTIERYDMFASAGRAVVAVSGGPDSTCLLDVMIRTRDKLDLELLVAHVDHGLNPDSEKVAHDVALQASKEGVDAHVVRARGLEGPNLQARARDFRYSFFASLAEQEKADYIVTAHTLDDRVETTLARLIHGSGTRGLVGIRPVADNRVRPLIDCRRSATRAYCEERGLDYYDDPANLDERFERVAVRGTLVAAIEDHWGPGAVEAIARSAERMTEDVDALEDLADRFLGGLLKTEGSETRIDLPLLEPLPRALRRRALEAAIGEVRDRAAVIDPALDALDQGLSPGTRLSGPGGLEVIFDKEAIRITRETPG